MGSVLHGLSYRLSSFPASLPHFFISLPGVNSQTNYMHTNLCFRVCFWGNPNPLSKSFTINQRLMRASLPVASSPPVFLCPAVPVCTPSPCNHALSTRQTLLASSLYFSAFVRLHLPIHLPIHPLDMY